ncbi:lytic transglycosylase domain-containing protein [Paraglaciecola aquimarina]|uniref:Lytic transglycosylase domain-containing protein n=1 Tax=Paraglaciecola aquimarina TaxID=1235557 RepID=A0ABU3T2G5_9ALTE|nr:lytic transglycosylase domain-containing protein [Paraglaciecola aquimarina]MDU0356397.1 lytic transglycosylase domain-containing protein [Paraglaciecola aquimarina]
MKVSLIITIVGVLTLAINHSALASFSYDPQEIQAKVIDEAIRQNISPSLALAIAKVESDFNPQALSHAGAKGVMQIMPRTAEQGFGVNRQRLFDPAVNIEIGIKFIKQLLERYDGRLDIALSHYNGGSAVKDRFGKLSVIPATQQYVEKVMSAQQSFLKHDALLQNTGRYGSLDNKPQTILASKPTPTTTTHAARAKNGISNNHHWQNPQIATLRALRIHNITRNYKHAP